MESKAIKRCVCGALIKGLSEKHIKELMKIHKKSKRHKELMEIKESQEQKK